MGAAAPIAAIGAAGLTAFGDIEKGAGTQAADEMQASELRQRAQYAGIAMTETSANMLDRLNTTLGNIDSVRASMHDDPSSPTGAALRGMTAAYGDQERAIKVGNIMAQASMDTASAAYLDQAGSFAYDTGMLGAGADVAKFAFETKPGTFGFPTG